MSNYSVQRDDARSTRELARARRAAGVEPDRVLAAAPRARDRAACSPPAASSAWCRSPTRRSGRAGSPASTRRPTRRPASRNFSAHPMEQVDAVVAELRRIGEAHDGRTPEPGRAATGSSHKGAVPIPGAKNGEQAERERRRPRLGARRATRSPRSTRVALDGQAHAPEPLLAARLTVIARRAIDRKLTARRTPPRRRRRPHRTRSGWPRRSGPGRGGRPPPTPRCRSGACPPAARRPMPPSRPCSGRSHRRPPAAADGNRPDRWRLRRRRSWAVDTVVERSAEPPSDTPPRTLTARTAMIPRVSNRPRSPNTAKIPMPLNRGPLPVRGRRGGGVQRTRRGPHRRRTPLARVQRRDVAQTRQVRRWTQATATAAARSRRRRPGVRDSAAGRTRTTPFPGPRVPTARSSDPGTTVGPNDGTTS